MSTTTADRNGTFPNDARSAFTWCIERGFNPLPGWQRTKAATLDGEAIYQRRVGPSDLDQLFPIDQPRNLGVVNGDLSGNLLDLDLDCQEAVLAAQLLSPPTTWRFRREGAKDSAHRLYRTDTPFREPQRKFCDIDGKTLLEARGSGHWSIWPPSIHPEGVPITWEAPDQLDKAGPPRLLLVDLEKQIATLAACCLIARHWPTKGASRRSASGGIE